MKSPWPYYRAIPIFLKRSDRADLLKVNLVPLLEEYLSQGYVAAFSDSIRAYLQWLESLAV